MIVLKAVLASKDREYISAWLDFVQGSLFGSSIRFTAFSQWEPFNDHMDEKEGRELPDLVIAEPEFLNNWLSNGGETSGIPWLMLSEGLDEVDEDKRLMKYQPLPALMDAVLHACRQPRRKKTYRPGQGALSIGVVSASGGSGKTAVAMHMAKQLGVAGYAVLYLNLETLDSSMPFLEKGLSRSGQLIPDAETGLSRLLYDLKVGRKESGKQGQVQSSSKGVDGYVLRHEALKSDVFWPLSNRKELLQMSREDTKSLIRYLADCGQYDVLILDGDSGWDGRSEGIFDAADAFVWLIEDDISSMHRWGQWMQHMKRTKPDLYESVLDRARFIVNKYRDSVINALPGPDLHLDAVLPYIPSWKQLSQEEVMLSSPIFQREVKRLCAMIVQDGDEELKQTGRIQKADGWSL
ncbi:ParA family protein [Paenibacillus sp. UMB7766-LJ446]|uniref:nucleotide-binding protein n=1 Tax=Paenibacillus sp. UMB7766-LJ446 TaxID=3046313 RepID=UPI00254BC5BB|nr:ParA family protein [Paenibacillus sp. UMB7766-LJ446]MDK8189361.1 ParA family protein [Paenibacillus sp. UMB7766-LJ446]